MNHSARNMYSSVHGQFSDSSSFADLWKIGWTNVALGALIYFLLFGLVATLMPTLYPAIIMETGWSRTGIMSFASFKFAGSAIAAFSAGFLIDKFGERQIILFAAIVTFFSLSSSYAITGLWHYYIVAVLLGITSTGAAVAIKTTISRWFTANQGRALGFTLVGAGLGATISPVLAEFLQAQFGWRATLVLYGVCIAFLSVPIVPFLAHRIPRDSGFSTSDFDSVTKQRVIDTKSLGPLSLSKLLHSTSFFLVAIAVFSAGFSDQAILQLTKVYLELDIGFSGIHAALVLSSIIFISLFTRVLFGWIYDIYSVFGIVACFLIACIGIISAIFIVGPISLGIFVLLRGTAHGGRVILVPVVAKHVFGDMHLPHVIGILTAIYSFGMATGPLFAGLIYDLQGSYTAVFFVCAASQLIGVLAILKLIKISSPIQKSTAT